VPALYIIVTTAICITLVYDTLNTGLGLGIVALGIPVYYFLMDNKNSEGTAGQSFLIPHVLTVIFVVSNSIISNLLNSDSKQIDL
jgi:heme/copper-type cytochrome/quinol oxidase subunit 4